MADKTEAGETDADTTDSAATAPRQKSLWHYAGLGVSIALLLVVVALAAVIILIPKLSNAVPLTVLTSSMEPSLPPGTLIIVKPTDPDTLAVGDVVTYQIRSGEPEVITHRIISVTVGSAGGRSFELQGDNNSDPDVDAVMPEQIQGTVWYSVPLVGHANNFMNGEARSFIIPVGAVLLFSYAGYQIASGLAQAAKKRRPVPAGGSTRRKP